MTKALILDVAERCLWTFVQAFAATFVATDLSTARAAALAGVAAVLAVVKGFAASRLGAPDAATLPASI